MDSKKSNKISDIVRLQQILKKWKKAANLNRPKNTNKGTSSSSSSSASSSSSSTTTACKSIKFIKRTLSFSSDISTSSASNDQYHGTVPKGFLAVCVGKELKRYIIPMEYLRHQAFGILLREAEEEFGFEQEGVLKIPCSVSVFEKILKVVEDKRSSSSTDDHVYFLHDDQFNCCFSPDSDHHRLTPAHHPQMCR